MQTLLHVARAGPDENVAMSAAAYFKNVVGTVWLVKAGSPPPFLLSDETKEACKALIVPATIESSAKVRKLLAEAMKVIADLEWPEKWPKLIEQLMPMLSFTNFAAESYRVIGAATCIRLVLRRYQYLTTDVQNRKRWPIHRMAQVALGPYLAMLQQLIPIQTQSSIELQTLILKTFWSCVQQEIPPVMYNNPPLVRPWIETLVRVLVLPIPDGAQPVDVEQKPKFCWWVLKKWASKVLYRVTSKHGVPRDVQIPPANPSDDIIQYEQGAIDAKTWAAYRHSFQLKQQFAAYYEKEISSPIFVAQLQMLGGVQQGVYFSPRVLTNVLRFTCFAVRQAQLWQILEPQVDGFLANILFRLIIVTPAEQRQFMEDPQEFILAITELKRLAYSSRLQAMYTLKDIVKHRKKKHLDAFMTVLGNNLSSNPPPEVKEACLCCLGSISEELLDNPKYAPLLESIFERFVFPEMNKGKQGSLLEWRALWLMGRFWDIKWKNWEGVLAAAKNIIHCLESPLLPVRLCAAEVIPYMCHLPIVAQAVEGILPHVVQRIISISNQVDSDEIMASLERLVAKYPTKMAPLALQLIPPVIKAFNRAAKEEGEAASMAAYSALDLIISIVDECAEHTKDPQQWAALETMLGPFILSLLGQEAQTGLWELGVKLLVAVTFEPPFPNTAPLWMALPALFKSWQEWAKDYMAEIAEAWDNFLTNDPARCAGSPEIVGAANEMIRWSLRPDTDMDQREGGLKLMQSLLANLRGKVDALVPPWLGLLFVSIKQETQSDNMGTVLDLVAQTMVFLWYNPVITIQLLESNKVSAQLLDHVITNKEELVTKKLKKMVLLGLSSLLYLPPNSLPASVKQRMPKLAVLMLDLQLELWEIKDEEERFKKAEEEGEDGFDDDGDLVTLPNSENVDDFGNVNDLHGGNVVDADFEEAGLLEGFEALERQEEEELCHSLDKFDEVIFWTEGWAKLANGSKEFGAILNSLSKKNKEKQTKMFALAEEKKRALQSPKK